MEVWLQFWRRPRAATSGSKPPSANSAQTSSVGTAAGAGGAAPMAIAKAALLLAVLTSPVWAGTDAWAVPPAPPAAATSWIYKLELRATDRSGN